MLQCSVISYFLGDSESGFNHSCLSATHHHHRHLNLVPPVPQLCCCALKADWLCCVTFITASLLELQLYIDSIDPAFIDLKSSIEFKHFKHFETLYTLLLVQLELNSIELQL